MKNAINRAPDVGAKKNKFSKFINLQGKYLTSLLILLAMSIGNVWAAYTPTADEVIILKDVYSATATDAGYSTHSAIAWGGTASTNSKKAGDPNNGGASTSSNVPCYSVKGNGGGKNITISITGCSKIIVYHEKHSSRYVELRSGSKTGTLIGNGEANTFYTEVSLTASTSYNLFLHGTTGSDDQDLYVYAVKLIKGTVTKHSVTYALNGGTGTAPTQEDVAEGSTFTVAAMPSGVTPPTSKKFDKWNDGTTDYAAGASYTMGTSNVTLTAQWKDEGEKSHDATLKALEVAGCTLNETFEPATTAYTIDLPFYGTMPVVADVTATPNDANAKTPEVSISGKVITVVGKAEDNTTTKTYTITVTIADTPDASSSLNLEQNVLNNTKSWDVAAALAAANIVVDGTNGLDSLNDGKTARNYPYLGLKFRKKDADIIKIVVPANEALNVKFGNVGVALTTTVNGVAGAGVAKASSGTYHLDADTKVREVVFRSSDAQTVTLQQVKIGADVDEITLPWKVTYNAGTGTCGKASAVWKGTALILPAVTAPTDYTFKGWYDAETEGNKVGDAGDSYTPTANITLYARILPDEYTVTYNGNGETSGSMAPVDVAWGDDYTALACAFEKENHSFAKWTVEGVAGITEIAAGSAFVMPKNDVTLTAQWVNELLVARIGDAYYESLPEAVAAATDGQTVYLLKDVTAGPGVMIESANAKNITIDFGGYTYIVSTPAVGSTNTKTQGFHFEQGCTITMQNGTIGSTGDQVKMLVQNYCDLTLLNITLDGSDLAGTGRYTLSNNCGNVVIGNGATIIAQATGVAFDVCYYASYPSVSVTVQPGATIDGKIEMSMSNNKTGVEENCQLIINGGEFTNFSIDHSNIPEAKVNAAVSAGTFDAPVENLYCAEGFVPSPQDPVTGKYTVEPKAGVCLVWADATGNNAMTVDATKSMYAATAAAANTKNTAEHEGKTGYKLNSRPANMSVALTDETFQEGDIVEVFVTKVVDNAGVNDKMRVFDANDVADEHKLAEGTADMVLGVNRLVLPATSTASLYLVRGAENAPYDMWNPYVAYIAVYRVIYPTLTAITIDGRAGVIDEANKTVAVQIPHEADLTNLTITSTVVRNAAHATTPEAVISNSGAWIEGANTYRVMDKDGDYTDYTITLTRDVLKHEVTFNTHGGSSIDPVEVEHNGYLAAAPADPTKEDYIFQYWSLTEDGAEVDVTTVQIDEDKEFHAVWASDGGIKLIDKTTGDINTTDFITGVTATEVNSEKAAAWNSTQGTFAGINNLGKLVQYNATTTQTKVKVKLYSTNNSPKEVYLHKILEGETTSVVETIAVASNTPVETEFYAFNDSKNRSIYLATNSTDVKILQVKVIESGDALPMFGQAGYSLNLNKGRIASAKDVDMTFEGMSYKISSGYGVIGSTELKVKSADGNPYKMSFAVTSPVTMTITESGANYYVYKVAEPEVKGDANAAGTKEFDLTAGTWIIESATTSEAKFTNIAFALPKCEAPVFGTLADIELCIGEAIPAIDGTATVSDGGDVTYKWYEEGSETVLATTATYTPAADGSYFVVATNSLAGHQDVSTTSDVVKVSHFASVAITTAPEDVYKHAGLDAELSVVAEGKNVTYEWFTCDDELGTHPVAFDPAETGASLNLTAIEAGVKYYQVVVTDECGSSASAVAKVEGFNDIALVDVTGDMTWDFSKANDGTAATSSLCNEAVLVNVPGIVNNSDFESDNIMATANKFKSGKLQASLIKFHTTVDGVIKVVFSNTGNKASERYLVVNGVKTLSGSKNETAVTYYGFVPAGYVVLTVVEGDGNMLNFTSVKFIAKSAADYKRDDEWMAPGELGTTCIPQGAVVVGAEMYELVGRNENGKIAFDNVEHMEPGKPYLFKSKANQIDFYYTDEAAATEPDNSGAMKGSFVGGTTLTGDELINVYYFNGTALWNAAELDHLDIIANRAYVQMNDVTDLTPSQQAPAAGRRRVVLGVNGKDQAQGTEDVQGDNVQSTKVLINGNLYIIRGEKVFDATGRLVK